jgi:hypothetical protein
MADKNMQHALLSSVLFLVLASPQLYRFTDQLFANLGIDVCDVHGCPTNMGLLLHALIFGGIVFAMSKKRVLGGGVSGNYGVY